MSLSTPQKKFIQDTILHLLDFSEDAQQLKSEIDHVRHVIELADRGVAASHDHPYYQLYQCLQSPKDMFYTLDSITPQTIMTVGEVRTYILELITEQIHKSTRHPITTEAWNHKKLLGSQIFEDTELFTTIGYRPEPGDFPFLSIGGGDKIYKAKLILVTPNSLSHLSQNFSINIDISVNLDPPSTRTIEAFKRFTVSNNQNEFFDIEAVLNRYTPEATTKIESILLEELGTQLIKTHRVTSSFFSRATKERLGFRTFLLDNFYCPGLLKGEFPPYTLIYQENPATIQILLNPIFKKLLRENLCNVAAAKSLTPLKMNIIGIHFPMLKQKKFTVVEITNLTEEQASILAIPCIINAMQRQVLTFANAIKLPRHLRSILVNPVYADYLAQLSTPWESISELSLEYVDYLQKPSIAKLVTQKLIPLVISDRDILTALNNSTICELLTLGLTTFADLTAMPRGEITSLLANPLKLSMLQTRTLSIKEMTMPGIAELQTHYYWDKINKIIFANDQSIKKKVVRCSDLRKELSIVCKIDKLDFEKIVNNILYMVLSHFYTFLQLSLLDDIYKGTESKYMLTINKRLHHLLSSSDDCSNIVLDLIEFIQEKLHLAEKTVHLQKYKNLLNLSNMRGLQEALNSLVPFCNPPTKQLKLGTL